MSAQSRERKTKERKKEFSKREIDTKNKYINSDEQSRRREWTEKNIEESTKRKTGKKNWHQMISNFLSQLEILSESGHQSYSNQI